MEKRNFFVNGINFQGIACLNSYFMADSSEPLMAIAVLDDESIGDLPFEQKDGFKVVIVKSSINHVFNNRLYKEWCKLVKESLKEL